jgi:hypothetical protein
MTSINCHVRPSWQHKRDPCGPRGTLSLTCLLYFMLLIAASSDHPCLVLDRFSAVAVANSSMIKRKRGFHGNSTSVGTLHAGHEKSARTKVHMCSQRRVILQTLLEFPKQRNKIVATVLTVFYTFNHSVQKYILFHHSLCFRNTVEPLLSGFRLTVPLKLLNCAETLLEFLEQENDSNFSDILTLRKFRPSIKLKRSKKTKQRFLTDFFKKDSWQPYVRQKVKSVTCIPF